MVVDLVLGGELERSPDGRRRDRRAAQHRMRRGDGARRVREREADATDPRSTPSTARRVAHDRRVTLPRRRLVAREPRARRRCRPTFGPPPTTASAPLPTPPPSAFAAGRAIASAETPRSARSLLHGDRDTRPSRRRDRYRRARPRPMPSARTVSCARRRSSSLLEPVEAHDDGAVVGLLPRDRPPLTAAPSP